MNPHDEVEYYYKLTADSEGKLAKSIETQVGMLDRLLKQKMILSDEAHQSMISEEQDVNGAKFQLTFVKK